MARLARGRRLSHDAPRRMPASYGSQMLVTPPRPHAGFLRAGGPAHSPLRHYANRIEASSCLDEGRAGASGRFSAFSSDVSHISQHEAVISPCEVDASPSQTAGCDIKFSAYAFDFTRAPRKKMICLAIAITSSRSTLLNSAASQSPTNYHRLQRLPQLQEARP